MLRRKLLVRASRFASAPPPPLGFGFRFARARATVTLAALTLVTLTLAIPSGSGAATREPMSGAAIGAGVDGLIIRGRWRATIALGPPSLSFVGSDSNMRAVSVTREATTLTIVQRRQIVGRVPELRVRVAHLRGVAASGAVDLTIEDRSNAPLFLDLSGTGTVRATGAVPLLRVTTSGSVKADLTALAATVARVHARQHSRLAIRARDTLTLVALDSARVSYAARTVFPTVRDAATLTRL